MIPVVLSCRHVQAWRTTTDRRHTRRRMEAARGIPAQRTLAPTCLMRHIPDRSAAQQYVIRGCPTLPFPPDKFIQGQVAGTVIFAWKQTGGF